MKKVLYIAAKTLREYMREPQVFLLLLATPLILIVLYYYSFGQLSGKGMSAWLRIVCVNRDEGFVSGDGKTVNAGLSLIESLENAEWDGQPVFSVRILGDERTALSAVREGRASLSLVIPPDYGKELAAGTGTGTPGVRITGDPASDTYAFSMSFLKNIIFEAAGSFSSGASGSSGGHPVGMPGFSYTFSPGTGTSADFDAYVPGLIIFGILFTIISTATTLSRERTMGTFQRFEASGTGSAGILMGTGLAQFAVAVVQVPLCLALARLFGFGETVPIGIGGFLSACFIGLLTAWSVLGAGYLTAAFARNETEATILGTLALVPFAFLSGALFPLPSPVLFTFGGHPFAVTDLLAASPAERALKKILVEGKGLESVWFEIVCILVLSFAYLVPGIYAFGRWGMKSVPSGKKRTGRCGKPVPESEEEYR